MELQSLWWNTISGAVRFVQDSLEAAANFRVLLLEEAPYMEHYLRILQERVRHWDSGLQFDIGFARDWSTGQDIEEALLNRCAPQADYHPMDGSRSEFIARNHLLAGKVLIVRKIEEYPAWLDVAVRYAKHSTPQNGMILVTYTGTVPLRSARKGISDLRWRDFISSYDMQMFASTCIAGANIPSTARNYITQIASRLARADPEQCEQLAVREIVREDARSLLARLSAIRPGSDPSPPDLQEIETILWEAQVQIFFPIIERTRRRFIEAYYDEFLEVIPVKDEFHKELNTPEDMELRHMWYYRFKEQGFRTQEDKRVFNLVYNCRNVLAHLKLLDNEALQDILAIDPTRQILS